jgi:hypothetical protein
MGLRRLRFNFLKKRGKSASFSQTVKASFVQDRIEPIGKTPIRIELLQILVNLNKGILTGILGILTVSQNVHRYGQCLCPVSFHDFVILLHFSKKTALEKLFVSHGICLSYEYYV